MLHSSWIQSHMLASCNCKGIMCFFNKQLNPFLVILSADVGSSCVFGFCCEGGVLIDFFWGLNSQFFSNAM